MVIRLGRNGRFLACSTYPEHKETRPLPGEEPPPASRAEGVGEVCPKCGEGQLVAKRGRFGAFAGCSRYPDCDYIHRDGPAAAAAAAVRRGVPAVRGGPPRHAARTAHRIGVLGLLALPEVPLHDVTGAGRRDARRRCRPGGAQWRRRDVPALRRDDRPAGGRRARDVAPRRSAGSGSIGTAPSRCGQGRRRSRDGRRRTWRSRRRGGFGRRWNEGRVRTAIRGLPRNHATGPANGHDASAAHNGRHHVIGPPAPA